jgi:outer membrane immunogenic protein
LRASVEVESRDVDGRQHHAPALSWLPTGLFHDAQQVPLAFCFLRNPLLAGNSRPMWLLVLSGSNAEINEGRRMKKLLLVAAALAGFAAPASAADLAARPAPYVKAPAIAAVYDWTGFYIGANGGYGWSRKCWDLDFFGVRLAEGCHDATGGLAGGQIGYRWQTGAFVFGVEGQGDWANLRGRNNSLLFPGIFTNESRVNAIGLITGQVGYAFNNVLLYVKGGGAVVNDNYRTLVTGTNVLVTNVLEDTRWGGVVGAGAEFGFTPNWSVGFEYDHLFMGSRNYNFTCNGAACAAGALFSNERIRQDVDMVTVRVNYRWGGAVVAKY